VSVVSLETGLERMGFQYGGIKVWELGNFKEGLKDMRDQG